MKERKIIPKSLGEDGRWQICRGRSGTIRAGPSKQENAGHPYTYGYINPGLLMECWAKLPTNRKKTRPKLKSCFRGRKTNVQAKQSKDSIVFLGI